MNKKLLVLLMIIGYCFFPASVFAKEENNGYKVSEAKKTCGKENVASWEKACSNKYGVNIQEGPYVRNSNYSNGRYTNEVKPRKITITGNKDVKYIIRIFVDDVGNLQKISKSKYKKILKTSGAGIDDYIEADMTNGKWDDYSVPAGKEALIVVALAEEQDSGKNCKNSSGGTEDVMCKIGDFTIKNAEVELEGNGASLFVQNPSNSGLVQNLRYKDGIAPYNEACRNSFNGYYIDKDGNKKYKLEDSELGTWQELFYNKVLGSSYCNKPYVSFNLSDNQINKISRKLLDLYESYKKFNSTSFTTIENLNKEIDNIKATINVKEFSQTDKLEISDLACSPTATERESKDYLYVKEEPPVYTGKLSDGKDYMVCQVKCYEHLTVSYSPPVTVKAGLCLQHKVTVKTVSKCGVTKGTDYLNALKPKNDCSPVPICSNDESHTQAGPNEDFDSCIQKCDNGKYSQSCINKCYKEVYETSSEDEENSYENTANEEVVVAPSELVLKYDNKNSSVVNVAFDLNNEEKLKKYYKDDNNPACSTSKLINASDSKIEECGRYFFYAKMLYPYGKYVINNKNKTSWKSCGGEDTNLCNSVKISDAGSTSKDIKNIPMQIARSSPFYLRSEEESINLLKDLLGKNSRGRKYNINSAGIKVQYNNSYVCKEKCTYTGCSKGDSLTAYQFTRSILGYSDDGETSDIEKIKNALDSCTVSSECNTTEDVATFDITANSKRTNGKLEVKKNGKTNKDTVIPEDGETIAVAINGDETKSIKCDSDKNFSMFVPADDDINTAKGVLGYCYEKSKQQRRSLPHYQATITIPKSLINLKTGAVTYCTQTDDKYLSKDGFCLPLDAANVNEVWWSWVVNSNRSTELPSSFRPEYNIKATSTNFGKYNWTIKYSCFYAVYNGTVPFKTPECVENCEDEDTRIDNHNFKIVDNKELLDSQVENIGFNWTSKAQIKSIKQNASEGAKTYAINPEKYREYVKNKGNDIYNSKVYQYHFYLSKQNLKAIKAHNKNKTYTSFEGKQYLPTGVEGLYAYRSDIIGNDEYMTLKSTNRDNLIAKNNDYGSELGGLLASE